jgi:GTPase SAR1 family protein
VEKWVQDIYEERGHDVTIMLVGNKMDLTEKREVSQEEALEKAQQAGLKHVEVSAKSGAKVKEMFLELARELPGMKVAEDAKAQESVKLTSAVGKPKDKCAC